MFITHSSLKVKVNKDLYNLWNTATTEEEISNLESKIVGTADVRLMFIAGLTLTKINKDKIFKGILTNASSKDIITFAKAVPGLDLKLLAEHFRYSVHFNYSGYMNSKNISMRDLLSVPGFLNAVKNDEYWMNGIMNETCD